MNIPSRPYIIGLTGNIASGKSSISNHLQKFGCGYVNCDELGHKIYEMGSEGYNFIKDHFGLNVLNEDGSVNRKQLGTIVFSDQVIVCVRFFFYIILEINNEKCKLNCSNNFKN